MSERQRRLVWQRVDLGQVPVPRVILCDPHDDGRRYIGLMVGTWCSDPVVGVDVLLPAWLGDLLAGVAWRWTAWRERHRRRT